MHAMRASTRKEEMLAPPPMTRIRSRGEVLHNAAMNAPSCSRRASTGERATTDVRGRDLPTKAKAEPPGP